MRILLRALTYLPLMIAVYLTAGCTGTDPGQLDPNAPSKYGDQAQNFAVNNGRLIASIIFALAGLALLRFFWNSTPIRMLGAIVLGGAIVYYAMGGGR